jgi:Ca2+-binding EF-hand superfamily protein
MKRITGLLAVAAALYLSGCSKDRAKPASDTSASQQAQSGAPERNQPRRNAGPGPLAGRHQPPMDRQRPPEGGPRGGQDRRAQFDTDGDGQLSDEERTAMKESMQAEREARRAEQMAKFDTDGDGKFSDAERAVMRTERMQNMVTKLDADGDGKVSQAELEARRDGKRGGNRPPMDFAAADTDHDGALSAEELGAAMPDRGDRGGFRRHDRDEPDAPDAPTP